MPKKKSPFPEKPWKPDATKWQKHLERQKEIKPNTPAKPDKGWLLYRLDTLEDIPQT